MPVLQQSESVDYAVDIVRQVRLRSMWPSKPDKDDERSPKLVKTVSRRAVMMLMTGIASSTDCDLPTVQRVALMVGLLSDYKHMGLELPVRAYQLTIETAVAVLSSDDERPRHEDRQYGATEISGRKRGGHVDVEESASASARETLAVWNKGGDGEEAD